MQRAPSEKMLRVPYGHDELEFMVQPWFDVDVVESAPAAPVGDLAAATRASLGAPLGSKRLRDLAAEAVRAAGSRSPRAVIAVTDLTRACPDDVLVPPLLDELNAGGVADADITVLVAVGLHRATTDAEKVEKLGAAVTARERVVAVAAGDPDAVLADLVATAAAIYTRPIAKQYDIAIAGVGAPKDVNLYQASRAATYLRFAPTPVVREGGSIIVPAKLDEGAGEGAGEQRFLAALERAPSPAAVVDEARRHFAGGEQRAVMVALTLQWCQIIVAASEAPEVVRLAKMRAAVDVEEALDLAYEHIGRPARASVLLVPRALHTLPVVQSGITA